MKFESISVQGNNNNNEDHIIVSDLDETSLVVVLSDGMGGKNHGKKASAIVGQSIKDFIQGNNGESPMSILMNALKYADCQLSSEIEKTRQSMGAATLAAIITTNEIHYIWQGNVRLYHLQDGCLSCLTKDHTIDIGYGQRRLTRCIKGCGLRNDVPYKHIHLTEGDILFLCTDGFYNQFQNELETNPSIEELKSFLVSPEDDASVIKVII